MISPLDDRYSHLTENISAICSEKSAYESYVNIELNWLKYLVNRGIGVFNKISREEKDKIINELKFFGISFDESSLYGIKNIEAKCNHDIKAVEIWLRFLLSTNEITRPYIEYIHIGLTSEDIKNLSIRIMFNKLVENYHGSVKKFNALLAGIAVENNYTIMAKTHGQDATPTTFKKEMYVYISRISKLLERFRYLHTEIKFGGATGNLNALYVAFPDVEWGYECDTFIKKYYGLKRLEYTTQVNNNDDIVLQLSHINIINNVLLDFTQDIWYYSLLKCLKIKEPKEYVGSSTMPHKINPIDFENAEGNIKYSNSLLRVMIDNIQISRLQRDLSGSTLLRNISMPFGHIEVAMSNLIKGIKKISLNIEEIDAELYSNQQVLLEAVQTVLRKNCVPDAYDIIKSLSADNMSRHDYIKIVEKFKDKLPTSDFITLKSLTPQKYY